VPTELRYEIDTEHVAQCDLPVAACPVCSEAFGLVRHGQPDNEQVD
jgi:hypothetical protein